MYCARRKLSGWILGQGFDSPRLHHEKDTVKVSFFVVERCVPQAERDVMRLLANRDVRFAREVHLRCDENYKRNASLHDAAGVSSLFFAQVHSSVHLASILFPLSRLSPEAYRVPGSAFLFSSAHADGWHLF